MAGEFGFNVASCIIGQGGFNSTFYQEVPDLKSRPWANCYENSWCTLGLHFMNFVNEFIVSCVCCVASRQD